jgi:ribosomal protein S18 acetylase RimI-like enzyme
MPVPAHFHRFWRRLDEHMGRVTPMWWGAVVSDPRFPAVSDANYARIDSPAPDLSASDVLDPLLPALAESGARVVHVVSFHPAETEGLFQELIERGYRRTWDVVMDLIGEPPPDPADAFVEELTLDEDLWRHVESSFALFGVEPPETSAQLLDLERALDRQGIKRWFAVRDGPGRPLSLAALLLLEDVAYLDNVCTFPGARGRGYASAVTTRAIAEGRAAGAAHVTLLADPDAPAVVRMYERLGFEVAGRLSSVRGAVEDQSGGGR